MRNWDKQQIKHNIEGVLKRGSPSLLAEALDWYNGANRFAKEYEKYGKPMFINSGIISCFSPQKGWYQNIVIAENYLRSGGKEAKHFGALVRKADQLYSMDITLYPTDDEKDKEVCRILHGDKICNFYHNIAHPGKTDHITLDVHMCQLLTGDMGIKVLSPKMYKQFAEWLVEIAKEEGFVPSELQAYLWLIWRIIKKEK